MTSTDDDRWLATLADRSPADSPDTRQAAALRDVLLTEIELLDRPDVARQQRIWNLVEAQLATDRQTARQMPGGLWARAQAWLFPDSGGLALRRAALAAGLMAVVAVPVVMDLQQPVPVVEDSGGIKSVPKVSATANTPVASVRAADPDLVMREVLGILAGASVPAEVRAEGVVRLVYADVPPPSQAQVADALRSLGIPLPTDGHLRLRVEPTP